MFKWVKKAARGSVGWAGNVFGYRMVVGGAHYIGDLCKALLLPGQRLPDETFEEALHRLNLTQEDVEKKRTDFLLQALLYFVCFLCVSGYVFYLFEQGAWYFYCVPIARIFGLFKLNIENWVVPLHNGSKVALMMKRRHYEVFYSERTVFIVVVF